MPLILNHMANGMKAYPLIVRPCAWQLEPKIAGLQARPADDRALSEGSGSEIDFNLSRFVYELARELEARDADEARRYQSGAAQSSATRTGRSTPSEVWEGAYDSDRPLRLQITSRAEQAFDGSLEYMAEGTITIIKGETHDHWNASEPPWSKMPARDDRKEVRRAVTFRELRYERRGTRHIEFKGSYHLLDTGNRLVGAWFSNDHHKFGRIELTKRQ